jgi:hypothetical protein
LICLASPTRTAISATRSFSGAEGSMARSAGRGTATTSIPQLPPATTIVADLSYPAVLRKLQTRAMKLRIIVDSLFYDFDKLRTGRYDIHFLRQQQ